MNNIQIAPKPGQAPTIGFGPMFFMSPNAPVVAQGDPWFLSMYGETPNFASIGHAMPWETGFTFDGGTDASGNKTIEGVCSVPGPHNINDGFGILLRSDLQGTPGQPAILPLMGNAVCQYGAAGPPPPPVVVVLGLPNLVTALIASRQSHVPVANWRTDFATVMYASAPPYEPTPGIVTIPFMYCLSDAKAAAIAALIGGTVKPLPPTGYYSDMWVVGGVLPNVNWIFVTLNGVPMKALGMALVQEFDSTVDIGAGLAGDLLAALTSAFEAA